MRRRGTAASGYAGDCAWICMCVCICACAIGIVADHPAHGDGGQLIGSGMLDGEPVVLFVEPAPPREGVVVLRLAGRGVVGGSREALHRLRVQGAGVDLELAMVPTARDPIAVEATTPELVEGNYSVAIPGMVPEQVALAIHPAQPAWRGWLPWLVPSGLVGLLAFIRPKLLRHPR